jgi:DNA-binding response OmpR family regulator
MASKHVLVIEDDPAIREGIVDALEFEGFTSSQAATGPQGMDRARSVDCDLVLLDLVLPGCDGLEILREIRLVRPILPVIILTARGSEEDRVAGLKLGADDYVVKPFHVAELMARTEAVLRRSPERPSDVVSVKLANGCANLSQREIRFDDGHCTELSEREVELSRYLVLNAGRPISRDEILSRVWRIDPKGINTRTIDMHIARLREKLQDDSDAPTIIQTIRGKGYMFREPVSESAGKSATGAQPDKGQPA